MAFKWHICAGCRAAHERSIINFPFTCHCGHRSDAPRSAQVESLGQSDNRPRVALGNGANRILPIDYED
jgi:hypothetical protein